MIGFQIILASNTITSFHSFLQLIVGKNVKCEMLNVYQLVYCL